MCTLEPSVYFHIWLSLLKCFVTQLDTNLLFRRVINWRKRLQLKSGTGYITMTTSWTLMNNNQEVAVFVRQSRVCVCVCARVALTDWQYGPGRSRPSGCGVHLDRCAHVGFWKTKISQQVNALNPHTRHVLVQFERAAHLLQRAEEDESLTWEKPTFCANTGLLMHWKAWYEGLGMEWSAVVLWSSTSRLLCDVMGWTWGIVTVHVGSIETRVRKRPSSPPVHEEASCHDTCEMTQHFPNASVSPAVKELVCHP